MTTAPTGPEQPFEIRCDVYTTLGKFEGVLVTSERRLSDAVNKDGQDFLLLQNVETAAFGANSTRSAAIVASKALFTRGNILLVTSHQFQASGPGSSPLYVPKSPVPSLIQARHWVIRGTLHVPDTAEGLEGLTDPQHEFIPVTNAHVTQDWDEDSAFDVPLVLANKHYIDMVVEVSRLRGLLTSAADGVGSIAVTFQAGAALAANLLGGTPLFGAMDRGELQERCAALVADGAIRGLRLPRGWRLVSQGAISRMVFLVHTGHLLVERTLPGRADPQHTAGLFPGDLVGESALVGEGRSSYTARTAEATEVLAIEAEAMKRLIGLREGAAASLLSMMLTKERSFTGAAASQHATAPRKGPQTTAM